MDVAVLALAGAATALATGVGSVPVFLLGERAAASAERPQEGAELLGDHLLVGWPRPVAAKLRLHLPVVDPRCEVERFGAGVEDAMQHWPQRLDLHVGTRERRDARRRGVRHLSAEAAVLYLEVRRVARCEDARLEAANAREFVDRHEAILVRGHAADTGTSDARHGDDAPRLKLAALGLDHELP